MVYANPTITVKIVRRFKTNFLCWECNKPAVTGQLRKYNKETANYTCSNFFDCLHCKFQFSEEPRIVPEYERYPRLDDDCFVDVETEVDLPVGMGECLSVEVVRVNLK